MKHFLVAFFVLLMTRGFAQVAQADTTVGTAVNTLINQKLTAFNSQLQPIVIHTYQTTNSATVTLDTLSFLQGNGTILVNLTAQCMNMGNGDAAGGMRSVLIKSWNGTYTISYTNSDDGKGWTAPGSLAKSSYWIKVVGGLPLLQMNGINGTVDWTFSYTTTVQQ